jgi:hypothetical protein
MFDGRMVAKVDGRMVAKVDGRMVAKVDDRKASFFKQQGNGRKSGSGQHIMSKQSIFLD